MQLNTINHTSTVGPDASTHAKGTSVKQQPMRDHFTQVPEDDAPDIQTSKPQEEN